MNSLTESEALVRDKEIAARIVIGEISAYRGAMAIWKEVVDHCGGEVPGCALAFKSNASAIEDIRWNAEQDGGSENSDLIRQCEAEIMTAARFLLDKP